MKTLRIKKMATTRLPTIYGEFVLYLYKELNSSKEHLVLICGEVKNCQQPILVRIHSACLTGDVFGSLRCDCGKQLQQSLKKIQKVGKGIIIYLDQEGRNIGLTNKIKAYVLQDKGLDTVEANQKLGFAPDEREFSIAAQILQIFGVKDIILMTNNPKKIADLEKNGVKVQRQSFWFSAGRHNRSYLQTKQKKNESFNIIKPYVFRDCSSNSSN